MISALLLFDVTPDPVSSGVGVTGLILIGVVVLILSVAALVGFVFLLRWLLRGSRSGASPTVREGSSQNATQFQPSNPNQP